MDFVDFILNVACLLLWLRWRSSTWIRSPRFVQSVFVQLKHPGIQYRYGVLAALASVLAVRWLIYWQIGSQVRWVPQINLGIVAISFRSDFPLRIGAFSLLSFLHFTLLFYLSLLLASILNRRNAGHDSIQRWIQTTLGFAGRWPLWGQWLFPFLMLTASWALLAPCLGHFLLIPPMRSIAQLMVHSVILGLSSYLAWKYLLVAILMLYLVNRYFYLGSYAIWTYVESLAQKILRPFEKLPLTFYRFDFRPLTAIMVILFASQTASQALIHWYQAWLRGK